MLTRNSYLASAILGGPAGLVIAVILYLAMAFIAVSVPPAIEMEGSAGLCFPSPNQWDLAPRLAMYLNFGVVALCVLLLMACNARFNIIPGTTLMHASLFLIATGAGAWTASRLTSSTIVLLGTLVCTRLLFALYGRKNASQGIFLIFSLLAWGSMIQYAFALLIPIFLLGAIFLNVMRLRECVGLLLGLLAPYWIVVGLGLVSINSVSLPLMSNLFMDYRDPGPLFFLVLGQAFTALLTLLVTCSNSLAAPTSGHMHRSYISFINLLGIAMIWFMLFDYTNMMAYSSVLAVCLGLQTARFATMPHHRFAYLPMLVAVPAYIALFILTLTQ